MNKLNIQNLLELAYKVQARFLFHLRKRVKILRRQKIYRVTFYLLGLLILALGITLNTKTGLGVSPIVSVPYSISQIWSLNFGNMTLVIYCIFVLAEFLLKGKNAKIYDILQIPLAIVFTRFMNLFSNLFDVKLELFWQNMLLLIMAVILTGVGAAMSLNMRIVPNPGDGIVQAISDFIHKEVGFTKNCFDLFNISITFLVGMIFRGKLIGIGVGTVVAVIGVGRAVAGFNYLCKDKMDELSGI